MAKAEEQHKKDIAKVKASSERQLEDYIEEIKEEKKEKEEEKRSGLYIPSASEQKEAREVTKPRHCVVEIYEARGLKSSGSWMSKTAPNAFCQLFSKTDGEEKKNRGGALRTATDSETTEPQWFDAFEVSEYQ